MTKKEEIDKLRARLLELGQPVIIPARELTQIYDARNTPPGDITLHPHFEEAEND